MNKVWKLTFLVDKTEADWYFVFATRKDCLIEGEQLKKQGYTRIKSTGEFTTLEPMQYHITGVNHVYFGA